MPARGQARVWTAEEIGKLGERSDFHVAAEMGIHPSTVMLKRKSLGIQAYKRPAAKKRTKRRVWTDAEISMLGTNTDVAIAKALGVRVETIGRRRTKYGIPKYKAAIKPRSSRGWPMLRVGNPVRGEITFEVAEGRGLDGLIFESESLPIGNRRLLLLWTETIGLEGVKTGDKIEIACKADNNGKERIYVTDRLTHSH